MDVAYFEVDYAPGRYFKCLSQLCTLSDKSCAAQYQRAKGTASKCNGCEIGAEHAGERVVVTLPELFCVRCGCTHRRVVAKMTRSLCTSCYNRAEEVHKGRNAKGKYPIYAKPMRWLEVIVDLFGVVRVEACSSAEGFGIAIRRDPTAKSYPVRNPVTIVQMRLFA